MVLHLLHQLNHLEKRERERERERELPFPIDCERETVLQESTTGAVLPVDTEGELVVIVNNKYISVSLSLLSCRQKCLHQEHEEPRKITLFLLNRGNGRKESTTNAAKVE